MTADRESTAAATTRSRRIVHEPTRLAEDDYVDQLGRLRYQRDQPWKAPDHVTKDDQIGALTAEMAELHEQSIKAHCALRTVMATHTREMKGKEPTQLKAINGKLIAAETSFEKLRDKKRLLVVPNQRCRRRS